MRSEKEMFELILNTAKEDERVRAVILNGSRANPNAPKDVFQDYDIVYIVTETASFIRDKEWARCFGEELIFQYPDERYNTLGRPTDFARSYGFLMQFTDGNRIDLHLCTYDVAAEDVLTDSETVVLLDKDDMLPRMTSPSDRSYWIKRPTQECYDACCNEYRWVMLYVAKGLWRGELLYALDHLNLWARPQLFQLLCWKVGTQTDFSCTVGKSGKYLQRYLTPQLWELYLQTFPSAQIDAVWAALFASNTLFEELAQEVSASLGLTYNTAEAQRTSAYARQIYEHPHD